MKTIYLSAICAGAQLLSAHAFAPSRPAHRNGFSSSISSSVGVVVESGEGGSSADASSAAAPASPSGGPPALPDRNKPNWEVKQHLYGQDMAKGNDMSVTVEADGSVEGSESLPLPETYITCGRCKSLFAISEEDLGPMGKGCRVQCTVCGNSWFQSRDRLFDIPNDSHNLLPMPKSDLDRIARNKARDHSPAYMGTFKLYVGNLDFGTTSELLLEFFEANGKVGSVCDASVITHPDGRSKGFAFVSFYEEEDGKAALELDGKECNGREVSIREPNN